MLSAGTLFDLFYITVQIYVVIIAMLEWKRDLNSNFIIKTSNCYYIYFIPWTVFYALPKFGFLDWHPDSFYN